MHRLLAKIDRNAYHPEVVSLSRKGSIAYEIEKLGITVHSLGVSSLLNLGPALVKLVLLLKNINPQIVHAFMIHAALVGGIIARLLNIPIIIWNIFSTDLS